MLLFLDLAYYDAVRAGKMKTYEDLREAIIHGAVKRLRPKLMTVAAAMMGLIPIMWSLGKGADMMKRIATVWKSLQFPRVGDRPTITRQTGNNPLL